MTRNTKKAAALAIETNVESSALALITSHVETIDDAQIEILASDAIVDLHESEDDTIDASAYLRDSFDHNMQERARYETSKFAHDCRDKVARYMRAHDLRASDATLTTTLTDRVFTALVDVVASFDFINSSLRESNRFNVYAIEKVTAKMIAIADRRFTSLDSTATKYCVCILADLDKNRSNAAFSLTRERAYAMFSNASANASAISRHDFARKLNVTQNTATTQASSSFRTLAALNVLRFDESRKIVSHVNFEHDLFAIYREQFTS